jgi:hypothetical protein
MRVSEERDGDVIEVIQSLLAFAKVAMPAEVFAVDSRILRARQTLAHLTQLSGSRPPSIIRSSSDALLELAFSDVPLDLMVAKVSDDWPLELAIDRFMTSRDAPPSRSEAVSAIVRNWLKSNGYLNSA